MGPVHQKVSSLDWEAIHHHLHEKGYAEIPDFLSKEDCANLIAFYGEEDLYRKKISMERYRFGMGEYKYFASPLPSLIQQIRVLVYPYLVTVANQWMQALHIPTIFPPTLSELKEACEKAGQTLPTTLILKYGPGGFNTLHQDLYGEVYFPLQLVVFLNEPGEEYTGGEFVLMQQNPRAQSEAIVLTPGKGCMLIFTTSFKPARGNKGYHKVHIKHGVSKIKTGERYTLGIIFHDAQ